LAWTIALPEMIVPAPPGYTTASPRLATPDPSTMTMLLPDTMLPTPQWGQLWATMSPIRAAAEPSTTVLDAPDTMAPMTGWGQQGAPWAQTPECWSPMRATPGMMFSLSMVTWVGLYHTPAQVLDGYVARLDDPIRLASQAGRPGSRTSSRSSLRLW